jgi:hypothetical protein
LKKHLSGNAEMLMEGASHRHRDLALAGKYLGNLRAVADERNKVSLSQACLLRSKFDGGDGAWVARRDMLRLVVLDEIGQDVELLTVRRAGSASMSA